MRIDAYRTVRFEGEDPEEETLFVLRAHHITNLGWIFTTSIVLVLPFIVVVFLSLVNTINFPVSKITLLLGVLIWLLVVVGVAFQQFVNWYFNIYVLTNKRLVDIDFFGLFHRRVSQTTLGNVQDVTYTKSGILQNFFDYGDIHLQTAGTESNFEFNSIPDPEGSQHQILELVAKYKKGISKYYGAQPT